MTDQSNTYVNTAKPSLLSQDIAALQDMGHEDALQIATIDDGWTQREKGQTGSKDRDLKSRFPFLLTGLDSNSLQRSNGHRHES